MGVSSGARRRLRRQRAAARSRSTAAAPVQRQKPQEESYATECSSLLEGLEAAGPERTKALQEIRLIGVLKLATTREGSLLLQDAIGMVETKEASQLLKELHQKVKQAVYDLHGNHVIQKAIQIIPTADASFIAEELVGQEVEVACHRFGCRVFCRMAEHLHTTNGATQWVDQILDKAAKLSRHIYGHFVIESVLEHGEKEQQRRIVEVLREDAVGSATHRYASHVVEKAFEHGSEEDKAALRDSMKFEVPQLGVSQYGVPALENALRCAPEDFKELVKEQAQEAKQKLEAHKSGRRLLKFLGLTTPRTEEAEVTAAPLAFVAV